MMRRISFLLMLMLLLVVQPAAASTLNKSEIKEKIKALAVAGVKSKCTSCKIKVECKWMATMVQKSSAGSISGLYFDNPGLPRGYVTAKIAFNNNTPSTKARVQLYISVQQKIPVAASTIKRGTPISKREIAWQWRDIAELHRRPVALFKTFRGKTAVRIIRKGHPFYASDLVGADSIRPGDEVKMQYDEGDVQIAIDCIAREAKGIGQKIRLYSKETGQRYRAKIISKNQIVWVKTL